MIFLYTCHSLCCCSFLLLPAACDHFSLVCFTLYSILFWSPQCQFDLPPVRGRFEWSPQTSKAREGGLGKGGERVETTLRQALWYAISCLLQEKRQIDQSIRIGSLRITFLLKIYVFLLRFEESIQKVEGISNGSFLNFPCKAVKVPWASVYEVVKRSVSQYSHNSAINHADFVYVNLLLGLLQIEISGELQKHWSSKIARHTDTDAYTASENDRRRQRRYKYF